MLGGPVADELDDVLCTGAGAEDLLEAQLLERRNVVVGDDAAGEQEKLAGVDVAVLQCLHHAREQLRVGAGQDAQADDVHVFLQRRLRDHLRRLADAGVDDLHPCVAQRPRDDLRAAVVAVQAGLRDQDADGLSGALCIHLESIM